jgi:hypothetical protein
LDTSKIRIGQKGYLNIDGRGIHCFLGRSQLQADFDAFVATPGVNLETPEDEKKSFKSMQACGSLSHFQHCTKADITFAVGMICRKMQDPTEHDWMAVKKR